MKAAIIKSLFFYVIAFSITAVLYFSGEFNYAHGPTLYHLTYLVTVLIGVIWLLISAFIYFNKNIKHMLGYIYVNSIVTIAAVIYIFILLRPPSGDTEEFKNAEEILEVLNIGDTSMLLYNSNIIYLQINDSVHLDLRDSAFYELDIEQKVW